MNQNPEINLTGIENSGVRLPGPVTIKKKYEMRFGEQEPDLYPIDDQGKTGVDEVTETVLETDID